MYGAKNNTAAKLGIKAEQVHVVSRFVGGAFGSKAQLTPRTRSGRRSRPENSIGP